MTMRKKPGWLLPLLGLAASYAAAGPARAQEMSMPPSRHQLPLQGPNGQTSVNVSDQNGGQLQHGDNVSINWAGSPWWVAGVQVELWNAQAAELGVWIRFWSFGDRFNGRQPAWYLIALPPITECKAQLKCPHGTLSCETTTPNGACFPRSENGRQLVICQERDKNGRPVPGGETVLSCTGDPPR